MHVLAQFYFPSKEENIHVMTKQRRTPNVSEMDGFWPRNPFLFDAIFGREEHS